MEDKLIHKDLSYKIRGILFTVQNELGRFRNEKQYGDAFEEKIKDLQRNKSDRLMSSDTKSDLDRKIKAVDDMFENM